MPRKVNSTKPVAVGRTTKGAGANGTKARTTAKITPTAAKITPTAAVILESVAQIPERRVSGTPVMRTPVRPVNSTAPRLCKKRTHRGEPCKKPVFRVKGENDSKCRLHYLMSVNAQNEDPNEKPETIQEMAAPVIKGLIWIGSLAGARNVELLKKHKIKTILNASGIEPTPSIMKDYNELGIQYHTFTTYKDGSERFFIDSPFNKYPDFTKKDFFRYVIQGAKILKTEISHKNKPVMSQCFAGMNRSAAVIAAYLILVQKMSYERAYALLRAANKTRGLDVLTNPNFRKALKELEEKRHLIKI